MNECFTKVTSKSKDLKINSSRQTFNSYTGNSFEFIFCEQDSIFLKIFGKYDLGILILCMFLFCSGCTTIEMTKENNSYKQMERLHITKKDIQGKWLYVTPDDEASNPGYKVLEKFIKMNQGVKSFIGTKESLPDFIKVTRSSNLNLVYIIEGNIYEMSTQVPAKHIATYPVSKFPDLVEKIQKTFQDKEIVKVQKIQESAKPVLNVFCEHKGKPNSEVLEKTKTVIEVRIINSGETVVKDIYVNVFSNDNRENVSIQSQQRDVDFIPVNGEKLVLFEISCPDINKIEDILFNISIEHSKFGQIANSQVSLKIIDGEYKAYRDMKHSSDKTQRKKLALTYLNSVSNNKFSGKYEKDVNRILDLILWQSIKSSCSKTECEEYMNIFSDYEAIHYKAVKDKYQEINDFMSAEAMDTYQGYQSFIRKYKNGRCVDLIKDRTTLEYWRKKPKTSNTLIQVGEIQKDTLEFEKAEKAFKESIKLDKNNVLGYERLGELLFIQIKDIETAKNYLIKAEELNSKDYQIYYMLASIYSKAGGNSQRNALKYYSKAIEINPDCLECYYFHARQCLSLLMREAAIKDFKWIIANADDSSFYYKSSKRYLMKLIGN